MAGVPAVVIAAPASGSGKTTVATGLIGALGRAGHRVAPFKVGPDYIDPGYHGLAAGRPGRNLDPVLVGPERVVPLYRHGSLGCDLAVVEGVMGLFDGRIDEHHAGPVAEGSTAQVAGLLGAPVILVVDARGHSQSLAALLHGFATFDSGIRLGGVILNRVGSERHDQVLRAACDRVGLPVLGSLPRMAELEVPSRHLGLIPAVEHGSAATAAVAAMTDLVAAHLDLRAIAALARSSVAGAAWDPETVVAEARGGFAVAGADGRSVHAGAVHDVGGDGVRQRDEAPSGRGEGVAASEGDGVGGDSVREGDEAVGGRGEGVAAPGGDGVRDNGARSGGVVACGGGVGSRGVGDGGGCGGDGAVRRGSEGGRGGGRAGGAGGVGGDGDHWGGGGSVHGGGGFRTGVGPVIAMAGGPAFTFGYAEHRELLSAAGARVRVFDPLRDELPSGTAGLVLPGGFPEEHAAELAANTSLLAAVRSLAARGLPVHAECAGLLYLTRTLDGHPMAGVVDADAEFGPRLTLGYRDAVALADSALWRAGERVRGHEFHRTRLTTSNTAAPAWGWRGSDGTRAMEGALVHRVHASYLHTHPAGNPEATNRFVAAATEFASSRVGR
ncbi:cobyrinate a,c-diamide synthase [Nocardia brasiliensis]|uniref:cobyrinate a,c-diamide synthase n=1 Tax=Nocardia brasiliensis TaxID=37326 RepID=UPI0002F6CA61|nr:cobyrinate a,c-diamide synthase [Nocardia brasiliensis]SUB53715.1 Cobyrinic acid A,C-diamide synthase [Nocardia brasiliensis]